MGGWGGGGGGGGLLHDSLRNSGTRPWESALASSILDVKNPFTRFCMILPDFCPTPQNPFARFYQIFTMFCPVLPDFLPVQVLAFDSGLD